MKIQKTQKKLDTLKKIIRGMNSNTVELIEASAQLEIKLRKPACSKDELIVIDNELEKLINKYSYNLNNKE